MIKNFLLAIFGIVTLFAVIECNHPPAPIQPGPADLRVGAVSAWDDSKRYDSLLLPGGGTAISDTLADTLTQHFIVKYLDSGHIKECYFSKKAIDHLFQNHPTANAIGCRYALDNDSLKIILSVYRIAQTEIDIPEYLDSTFIMAKAVCPPTCPPEPK